MQSVIPGRAKREPGKLEIPGLVLRTIPECLPPSLLRRLFAVGVALGGAGQNLFGDQAGVLADRRLDLRGHVRVGLEERFCVLAALAEPLAVIGEPGAGFLDDAGLDAEVENLDRKSTRLNS